MKQPKRNKKLMKHLDELTDILNFYMGKDKAREQVGKIEELREALETLSIDQKEHDIRLIKKWEQKKKIEEKKKNESKI